MQCSNAVLLFGEAGPASPRDSRMMAERVGDYRQEILCRKISYMVPDGAGNL